jgi:succinate dehydrogenase / fumarate reductase iron-sulfur subunit
MQVTLRVARFDPETDERPHIEAYDVPAQPMDRMLDLLHWVKWNLDGSLTFRRSCGHGICGSDAVLINGFNRLACKTLVRDVGTRITVEALPSLRVLKDLVVDMEPFFDQYRSILPYLVNDEPVPDTERLQSQAERARFDDTTKCILCAACTSSCPVFMGDKRYVGPQAIVAAHRFIFDSRDRAAAERLSLLNDNSGAWRCRTVFNCTDCCPRGIKVTQAITDVKRALLFDAV